MIHNSAFPYPVNTIPHTTVHVGRLTEIAEILIPYFFHCRISSLKCGHFFGFSCIEKWLSSAGGDDCPNCNEKASKNDIRQHYVSNLHGHNGKIHGNR